MIARRIRPNRRPAWPERTIDDIFHRWYGRARFVVCATGVDHGGWSGSSGEVHGSRSGCSVRADRACAPSPDVGDWARPGEDVFAVERRRAKRREYRAGRTESAGCGDAARDGHANQYSNRHAYEYPNQHTDRHADQHTYEHSYEHTDRHADQHAHVDADWHSHKHADWHAHRHAD